MSYLDGPFGEVYLVPFHQGGRYHLGTGIMTVRSFACSVMRQTDPGKDILVRLSKSPDFERHYSSGA